MKKISEVFLDRSRATLLLLIMVLIFGIYSYVNIAREKNPDIQIPILYVHTTLRGISPIDAERLLVRPMETELRSIQGVDEMSSTAVDGRAYVILKFEAGFDNKKALEDVRAKLDGIRSKLPSEADSPTVSEVNLSLFPVLNVALIGDLPERTLLDIARDLQNRIESLPNVLSADIAGSRKDIIEVIISPHTISSYNLQLNDVLNAISSNNRLIGAGNLNSKTGSYTLKIPGVLENIKDIINVPLKVNGDSVVTIGDVATIRSTFEDATGFARVNGKPCLVLEVSKRTGKNVIDTVNQVKNLIVDVQNFLPKNLLVVYSQDQSDSIINILNELQNTIIIAILLVVMVIMVFMGTRISMLVALSIPGSFLMGIAVIYLLGYTLNIVVLFALIMAVGMLVDDSIVVSEYADRKMISGLNKQEAFRQATHDMFWPVASATLTKLAVFFPLLFWPGTTGEFMKYIPIALITTLTSSWIMALIFIPALGSIFGKPSVINKEEIDKIIAIEEGNTKKLSPAMKFYVKMLEKVLNHPIRFTATVSITLIFCTILYFKIGPGIEFFPKVEPDNALISIRTRGNLSIQERDNILRTVENRILNMKEIKIFYSRSGLFQGASKNQPDDLIAKIQLEFHDWRTRRKAQVILDEIKEKVKDIKGVIINVDQEKMGPSSDKPIQINLSSRDSSAIEPAVKKVFSLMNNSPGFTNIQDSRSSPEIEWNLEIDRNKAARFGTDINIIGGFVQMITNGVIVGKYRPNHIEDEVDIIARFPKQYRNLNTLDNLFINTINGSTSVSSFVTRKSQQKLKKIDRIDGMRTLTISSDVLPEYLVNERVKFLQKELQKDWDSKVLVSFKGETKDQKEAQQFLTQAFLSALMLMVLILVIEFDSVYHTFIVMTAIFLSTTCVFLGLLITNQTFGVVMGGVGIIALAGIVVNNNILLIDAFHANINQEEHTRRKAIIKAAVSRVRPILLTAGTAILGFLPMIFKISIDFFQREISYNSPSSQLWVDLSTTISIGLLFSTILTLFFTPALLIIGHKKA